METLRSLRSSRALIMPDGTRVLAIKPILSLLPIPLVMTHGFATNR
jgi:hypothetical protein